jgi:hypothetical protein
MAINLPDLGRLHCQHVKACGRIKSKSKKTLDLLHGGVGPFICDYKRGGRQFWVLAIFGGGPDNAASNHFHIEVTADRSDLEYVSKAVKTTEAELQSILEGVIGRTIEVVVTGVLKIRPELASSNTLAGMFAAFASRAARDERPATDPRVIFRVPRSPFRIQEFYFPANGKYLEIELSSLLLGKIDEDYLVGFSTALEATICSEVLGASDEPAK